MPNSTIITLATMSRVDTDAIITVGIIVMEVNLMLCNYNWHRKDLIINFIGHLQ